jgi:hypothetical protein
VGAVDTGGFETAGIDGEVLSGSQSSQLTELAGTALEVDEEERALGVDVVDEPEVNALAPI